MNGYDSARASARLRTSEDEVAQLHTNGVRSSGDAVHSAVPDQ
jgi:hypothetical protein